MDDRSAMALGLGCATMLVPLIAGIVFGATFLSPELEGIAFGTLIAGPILTLLLGVPGILIASKERRRLKAAQQPAQSATTALAMSMIGLIGILGCGGLCLFASFLVGNLDLKF